MLTSRCVRQVILFTVHNVTLTILAGLPVFAAVRQDYQCLSDATHAPSVAAHALSVATHVLLAESHALSVATMLPLPTV